MYRPMETMIMSMSVQRVIRGLNTRRSVTTPKRPTTAAAATTEPIQPSQPPTQAMTNTAV